MKAVRLAGAFLFIACAVGIDADAQAQTYDHLHLAAADPARAVAWYREHLGAQPGDLPDRVQFGRTIFAFIQSATAQPSAGAAIDHIGLSFPNVESKVRELTAAGATVVTPPRDVPGLFKLAFVQDPFGVKIELVEDAELLGFHHIHIRAPNPEGALAWYLQMFGGERAKLKGRIDAVKYTDPDVWLIAEKAEGAPRSQGRAIDHLGWRATNVDSKIAELKQKGVNVTGEPRDVRDLRVAFVEDPSGVRIELVRRPAGK
jgi:catechol 2,3-dioxygenase-like lactoylglutathione lyase family enzyme